MEEVYALSLLPYGIKYKQLQDKYNRRFGGTINDIFFDYEMIKDIIHQYSNTSPYFEFEREIYSQAITILKDPKVPKEREPFNDPMYHTGIYKDVILLIFKLNGARSSKINLLNCLLPKLTRVSNPIRNYL